MFILVWIGLNIIGKERVMDRKNSDKNNLHEYISNEERGTKGEWQMLIWCAGIPKGANMKGWDKRGVEDV
jgi:hypothetical protein